LAERNGLHQAKPKTLSAMQADEYIARRVQLENLAVCKDGLDQSHAISEGRHLVAQLREQAAACAARLRIIDLDHQVSGIVLRKCALKCLDCAERIFSCRVACGFENANKGDLV